MSNVIKRDVNHLIKNAQETLAGAHIISDFINSDAGAYMMACAYSDAALALYDFRYAFSEEFSDGALYFSTYEDASVSYSGDPLILTVVELRVSGYGSNARRLKNEVRDWLLDNATKDTACDHRYIEWTKRIEQGLFAIKLVISAPMTDDDKEVLRSIGKIKTRSIGESYDYIDCSN